MAYAEPTGTHSYNNKQGNASNGPSNPAAYQKFDEDGDLPEYAGSTELPAESVIAMAQSVGVTLNEDIAGALGEIAMRKLRYATLLAMQFSEHGDSSALRVLDFSRAEDSLNSPSFGHKSSYPFPGLKTIGAAKISVFDEGPEIDLLATSRSSKVSEIEVEDLDPTLFRTEPYKAYYTTDTTDFDDSTDVGEFEGSRTAADTSFDLNDIPLLNIKDNNYSTEDEDETNSIFIKEELQPNDQNALVPFNHNDHNNEMAEQESNYQIRISSNCFENSIENHVDETLENGPINIADDDHDLTADMNDIEYSLLGEGYDLKNCSGEVNQQQQFNLDSKWIKYMEVFVECFLSDLRDEHDPCEFETWIESDDEDDNPSNSKNHEMEEEEDDVKYDSFKRILIDLRKYGAYPVLDVICDLFRDYIRGLIIPVSVIGLKRIFSVINAFLNCPSTPSVSQMRTISSVLIEVFILPPPCEVQQYLTQVFMQILKRYDELLTWTCTYITEVLKKTIEMPSDDINEAYKCVIHGALCLTNGLEMFKIQVAQEFGWHTSIVNFSRKHYRELDKENFCDADGYIEEQILMFCRNFLHNYKRLVSSVEMQRIHKSMQSVFGEKLIPFLCSKENMTSRCSRFRMQKTNTGPIQNLTIRKGYYKNRKVKIPYKSYKSLLSSGLL